MNFPEVETISFDKKRFTYCINFDKEYLQETSTEIIEDILRQCFIIRIEATLFGEDSKRFITYYPNSAWQFFKQDHMPKWFIKRYPVKKAKIVACFTEVLNRKLNDTKYPVIQVLNNLEHINEGSSDEY